MNGDYATQAQVGVNLVRAGVMTANELREELGWDPHPDGDKLVAQATGGRPAGTGDGEGDAPRGPARARQRADERRRHGERRGGARARATAPSAAPSRAPCPPPVPADSLGAAASGHPGVLAGLALAACARRGGRRPPPQDAPGTPPNRSISATRFSNRSPRR